MKNSTTLNVLSIDYDYFMKFKDDDISVISEFPDGTEAFIGLSDYIWATRLAHRKAAEAINTVTCNTDELFNVRKFIMKQSRNVPVLITNSHVHIYEFIKSRLDGRNSIRVANLDFHHDAYDKTSELNCGNWVNFLDREFTLEYDWITSDCGWEAAGKKPGILDGRTRFRNIVEFTKANQKFKPDIIFICRSDVWVPPHLDREFVNFSFDVCGRFNDIMGDPAVLRKRDLRKHIDQLRDAYDKMKKQIEGDASDRIQKQIES